jgi:Protein of unknown function (DUF1488)
MALTRANERYTYGVDGIHFLMHDGPIGIGPMWVVCRVTLEALSQFGRTMRLTEPTDIFETGRDAIERAASNKYDRTTRVPYEILTVTIEDLDVDASQDGPDLNSCPSAGRALQGCATGNEKARR